MIHILSTIITYISPSPPSSTTPHIFPLVLPPLGSYTTVNLKKKGCYVTCSTLSRILLVCSREITRPAPQHMWNRPFFEYSLPTWFVFEQMHLSFTILGFFELQASKLQSLHTFLVTKVYPGVSRFLSLFALTLLLPVYVLSPPFFVFHTHIHINLSLTSTDLRNFSFSWYKIPLRSLHFCEIPYSWTLFLFFYVYRLTILFSHHESFSLSSAATHTPCFLICWLISRYLPYPPIVRSDERVSSPHPHIPTSPQHTPFLIY